MIYQFKRFSTSDSYYRPNVLDLPRIEENYMNLVSLKEKSTLFIIDGIRNCDEPESIMRWVKTGEVEDPQILEIMKETGLSFPAAYIESQKQYSLPLDQEELVSLLNSGVSIKEIMGPRYNPDGSPDRLHGLTTGAIRGAVTGFIFG